MICDERRSQDIVGTSESITCMGQRATPVQALRMPLMLSSTVEDAVVRILPSGGRLSQFERFAASLTSAGRRHPSLRPQPSALRRPILKDTTVTYSDISHMPNRLVFE